MRKVRVLLASPLPPPEGGIATWTRLILRTPPGGCVERIHVDTAPGRVYHYTRGGSIGLFARQALVAARVLWRVAASRPTVFHLTSSYDRAWLRDAAFLALGRIVGARTIINLRGGDFERFFREAKPARQRGILRTLRSCALIVPVTSDTAAFLASLGLPNVEVIPNCIDVRPRAGRAWTRPLQRWLYVGWVMPSKGLLELLDALRAVPDAHLTIVGPPVAERDCDSRKVLANAMSEPGLAGRIAHVPRLTSDQVREIYSEHDLFVFPSRREGFPNAVLEAMEAGLPVVATDVGAIPEMIKNGVEGLVVRAGDADALLAAIRRVAADPALATAFGRSARCRVSEHYEVESILSRWEETYRRIEGAHSRRLWRAEIAGLKMLS